MAWQLVSEVLDHAPADLTPGEVLVLVAIAEWADVDSRRCWRTQPEVERRVRISSSGLRAAYRRLAERGLDPRVVVGQDGKGRPRYAWKGHACTFELPRLAVPSGCSCSLCRHHSGATTELNGDTTVRRRRHHNDAQPVQNQKNHARGRVAASLTAEQHRQELATALGLTVEQLDERQRARGARGAS